MDRTLRAPASSTTGPLRANARYVGIDLARFLAVVGMIANHLVAIVAMSPTSSEFDQRAGEIATTLTSGIAAALFAVLGGVSAVFASRRALAAGRTGAAITAIVLRGLVLIVIGLLLGGLDSPIIVVLAYYGVSLIVVSVWIAAPSWLIALAATVLWAGGGFVNVTVRHALMVVDEAGTPSFESLAAAPLETVRGLLVTGVYPAITWVAYLLVGILIARALLAASARGTLGRRALSLAAIGVVVATVATLVSNWTLANLDRLGAVVPEGIDPDLFVELISGQQFGAPVQPELWSMLVAAPHSGTPIEMFRTVGISLAVIGLLVTLFDSRSARPGRFVDVFRAAGAAPLTIYTLHIIATSMAYAPLYTGVDFQSQLPWWVAGPWAFAVQLAGVLLIGIILSATGKRGPLEAITSGIARVLTRS